MSADEIDAAVARVLARPEFHEPPPTPWQRFTEWCGERLRELSEWFRGWELDAETVRDAGDVVLWVAGAATLALVGLALVNLLRGRRWRDGVRPSSVAVQAAAARSFEAELAAATAAAAAGAFLAAAHALYLAVLLWLDGARLARFGDDKTGAEYARELAPGSVRQGFVALLAAFYPVAYGGRADAAGAYARMRALAAQMGMPVPGERP